MIGKRKGETHVAGLRTTGSTLRESRADEMEERFFELLAMDREAGDFLARFWELDRMLENAIQAESVAKEAAWDSSPGRS